MNFLLGLMLISLVSVESISYFHSKGSLKTDSQRRFNELQVLLRVEQPNNLFCKSNDLNKAVCRGPYEPRNYALICKHLLALGNKLKTDQKGPWYELANKCLYFSTCLDWLGPPQRLAHVYGHLLIFLDDNPQYRAMVMNRYIVEWGGRIRDLEHTSAMIQSGPSESAIYVDENGESDLFDAFETRLTDKSKAAAQELTQLTKEVMLNKKLGHSAQLVEVGDKLAAFVAKNKPLQRNVTEAEIANFGPVRSLMAVAKVHSRANGDKLRRTLDCSSRRGKCSLINALIAYQNRKHLTKIQKKALKSLIGSLHAQLKKRSTPLGEMTVTVADRLYQFLTKNPWAKNEMFDLKIKEYGTVHQLLTAIALRLTCVDCVSFTPPPPNKPMDCSVMPSLIAVKNNRTDLTDSLSDYNIPDISQNIFNVIVGSKGKSMTERLRNTKLELMRNAYASNQNDGEECVLEEYAMNANITVHHGTNRNYIWGTVKDFIVCDYVPQ